MDGPTMSVVHEERRKTPRRSFSALAVLKTAQGPEVSTAQVVDLSLGGSRVLVDRPVQPDQEFVLVIKAGAEEIVVRGVVVHAQPGSPAGLSFTRMSDEARARLEQLIGNPGGAPSPSEENPAGR
jgi:hypothetical protein